jgi:hypothetical protein
MTSGTSFRQFDAMVAAGNALSLLIQRLKLKLGRNLTGSDINQSELRKEFLLCLSNLTFNGSWGDDQLVNGTTHARQPGRKE